MIFYTSNYEILIINYKLFLNYKKYIIIYFYLIILYKFLKTIIVQHSIT